MRGIEFTADIDKLATTRRISVSFFVAVFGHKRGSLKMKSKTSGGARDGKRFASRSKLPATVIA